MKRYRKSRAICIVPTYCEQYAFVASTTVPALAQHQIVRGSIARIKGNNDSAKTNCASWWLDWRSLDLAVGAVIDQT
jgi:hypothetical protein